MRTIILLLDLPAALWWRDDQGGGPIDESTMPISEDLKQRIGDYHKRYGAFVHQEPERWTTDLENEKLDDDGVEIWKQLREEVAGRYQVLFRSEELGENFESEEEFEKRRKEVKAQPNRIPSERRNQLSSKGFRQGANDREAVGICLTSDISMASIVAPNPPAECKSQGEQEYWVQGYKLGYVCGASDKQLQRGQTK